MIYNFDNLLKSIQHKDEIKSTTTLQFKKDLIEVLIQNKFDGDILEVGTATGNTTVVLASVAKTLGKKVIGFDYSEKSLIEADKLCKLSNLDNYKLIKKDVYKEEWGLNNIGFVFIDCIHAENNFKQDLENSIAVSIDKKPIIIAHDYGLITKDGKTINTFIKESNYIEVVRFLGEKDNWNKLGSGTVIDWEGCQMKILG